MRVDAPAHRGAPQAAQPPAIERRIKGARESSRAAMQSSNRRPVYTYRRADSEDEEEDKGKKAAPSEDE